MSAPRDDNWLILQNFYNGLTQSSRDHVDAAAGWAFFSLILERATTLIEKMVSNQGWSDNCLQLCQRGMHSVEKGDMLAIKLISSSRNLRIILKIRLKCKHFKPWKLAWHVRSAGMLDIRATTAQKPKKKHYISMVTAMGFIHKEVRVGINHAHIIKEVMAIQILSILTYLPWEILSTAKRRSMSPFRRSWPL